MLHSIAMADIVSIREGEHRIAVRRNELVLGHFRLSVWAQRLFLILIAHVDDETTRDTVFRFEIAELARWLKIDRSNLYSDIIPAIQELERTKIKIERTDGNDGYITIGLIQNRQGFVSKGRDSALRVKDGMVEFFVYEELLPFVKELSSRFTKTELVYALRLKSSFSQKIYDLLKANRWRGGSFTLDIEDMRSLLDIGATEYAKFSDLRRNILEVAEREIGEKTDIRYVWGGVKRGNKIVAIKFSYTKLGGSDIEFLPDTDSDKLLQRLTKAGLRSEAAADLVRIYGADDPSRITWHLDEALRLHKAGKLKNHAAWIHSGIKEDWRPQKPLGAMRRDTPTRRGAGAVGESATSGVIGVGDVLQRVSERASA